MSLVITSNQFVENGGDYHSAFSYRNHLTGTTRIPANSEIACASLKINKNGTISINKSMVFYQYFNQELVLVTKPFDEVTGAINEVRPKFYDTDEDSLELMPKDLAERLEIGINESLFSNVSSAVVGVVSDSDGFKGFKITYTQLNASASDYLASLAVSDFRQVYSDIYPEAGLNWVAGTKRLNASMSGGLGGTGYAKQYNVALLEKHLHSINGSLECNLSGVGGANWTIGLCRSDPDGSYYPSYYTESAGSSPAHHSFTPTSRSFDFYDFKICAEQDGGSNRRLRVYHAIKQINPITGNDVLVQQEVPYYNIVGNPFFNATAEPVAPHIPENGTPYDWSTNASAITDCKINLANETIEISLFAGATEYKIIEFNPAHANASGVTRRYFNFKPVCDSCRILYPKFHIDSSSGGKHLILSKVDVTGLTSEFSDPLLDWYSYHVLNGRDAVPYSMDMRYFNDMSLLTQASGTEPFFGIYQQLGLTGKILTNYQNVLIVNPSDLYQGTDSSNFSLILGYANRSIIIPTSTSGTAINIFESQSVPSMKSNTSLFVRLNNLGFNSINAGKGNLSKILYSIPRFSQDGSSVGSGLYFEPHERIYLPLNNPNELVINEFWVDFVNENETLATDLTGKSVAIFHIRERKDSK